MGKKSKDKREKRSHQEGVQRVLGWIAEASDQEIVEYGGVIVAADLAGEQALFRDRETGRWTTAEVKDALATEIKRRGLEPAIAARVAGAIARAQALASHQPPTMQA